jgi:hypothetical protein
MSEQNEQTEGKQRKQGIKWKQQATVVTKSFEANGHSYAVHVSPTEVTLEIDGPECTLRLNAKPGLDVKNYRNVLTKINNLVVGGEEAEDEDEEEGGEGGESPSQGPGAEASSDETPGEATDAQEAAPSRRGRRGQPSAEA